MNELIRIDIASIILAVIVLTFALIALGLSFFRVKSKDLSLLTFGTFTFLYAIRWLALIQTIQAAAGFMAPSLLYIRAFITYVIPIPFFLFLIQVFGKGRFNLLQWVFRAAILFAAAGIFSDIIQRNLSSLGSITSAFVLLCICASAMGIIQPANKNIHGVNVLMFGIIVLILFVINTNLVNMNLLPWRWRNEELGVLFLVFAMGFVAAQKFIINEKKLLSVELEMATACEIQSRILPDRMPKIKGLDIAARYIPMSAVAGDFYDFLIEDDKRVCILVADVSGHGVGAALIGSMLKIAFVSQAEYMSNPAAVLKGINRTLCGRIEGSFVTACCIFIDTERGDISYANAGHPPPLCLLKNEEEIIDMGTGGIIMGYFPEAKYENVSLSMKMDYRILIYTDGIVETRNRLDEFFGDERLKDFLKANSNLSASEFTGKLIQHLYRWSGKSSTDSLDDDLTVVVVDAALRLKD